MLTSQNAYSNLFHSKGGNASYSVMANTLREIYDNADIIKVLDISAFDGNASGYVIHSDGRVVIDHSSDSFGTVYNFFGILREHSHLSEGEITKLSEELKQGNTGAMFVELNGTKYYLVYEKSEIQDWTLLGIAPAKIVNASMKQE